MNDRAHGSQQRAHDANQTPSESGLPILHRPVPAWADVLVRLLDRALVIPGVKIPIGLDAIVGFFAPGAGDMVGAIATLTLVYLAVRLRVPRVILLRMLVNVGLDAVVGCVPLLGDAFDVYFRAGERNLALLRKHSGTARAAGNVGDYAVVTLAVLFVLGLLALPWVIGLSLVHWLLRLVGS